MRNLFNKLLQPTIGFCISVFLLYLINFIGNEVVLVKQEFNSFYYDDVSVGMLAKAMPESAQHKLTEVQSRLELLVGRFALLVYVNSGLVVLSVVWFFVQLRKSKVSAAG